ncbi:hypothetical protein JW964_25455, partial [candidate division KSB1 bacterium]|nr:hypothetical protein [candidate division KSB1 bacterium]
MIVLYPPLILKLNGQKNEKTSVSNRVVLAIHYRLSNCYQPGKPQRITTKSRHPTKKEALAQIPDYYQHAEFHKLRLLKCARWVVKADYNLNVITEVARIISSSGSNTTVLLEIAESASETGYACPAYHDLIVLATTIKSDSQKIKNWAQALAKTKSTEDSEQLRLE